MVPPKKKSKRQPVRLRHKIEKRVNAKGRKERKEAKKHPELHRKKKPEKLNIPNSYPYKDRLLAEIEEERRRKEEERLKRIEEAKKRKKEKEEEEEEKQAQEGENGMEAGEGEEEVGSEFEEDTDLMDEDDVPATGNSAMAALLASARQRAMEYEEQHEDESDSEMDEDEEYGKLMADDDNNRQSASRKDTSRKAFDKMFKTVLDAADVILYVLDARDPNGTRSRAVERQIMAAEKGEKRLILILNKIDLVAPHVLKGWLTYLRRYFPTLPLKATNSAPNAQTFDHKQLTMAGTSQALFKALKSYANHRDLKRAISVGVIGYPNVGKSSVINALTSRVGGTMSACPVGAEAGVTTSLREVKLDKKLKIIDSPGIIFPSIETSDSNSRKKSADESARLILINAVPPKQILDPVPAVTLLLKRLSTSQQLLDKILALYNIPPLLTTSSADLTNDFLVQVARKRGRLGKGGVPNINSAALCVINDWRDGRIQGWVDPPVNVPTIGAGQVSTTATTLGIQNVEAGAVVPDQKEIVTEWAKEFKIEGLWGDGEGEGGEDVEMVVE